MKQHKIHVDVGYPDSGIALGLCYCGARFLALSEGQTLARLAAHEITAHPGTMTARRRLQRHRARR